MGNDNIQIKYCHKIFDIQAVRELTDVLLNEAFNIYQIRCQKLAFDSDHVHIIFDMGIYSKPEIAKKLKGFVAKKLFELIPWLKKRYFYGSGLWNPAYDIRNVNDMNFYQRYLSKQKYYGIGQKMLSAF